MTEYKKIMELKEKTEQEIETVTSRLTPSKQSELKYLLKSFSSVEELRKSGTHEQIESLTSLFETTSLQTLDKNIVSLIASLNSNYKVDFDEVFSLIYETDYATGRTKDMPVDCNQVRNTVFWDQVEYYIGLGWTPQQAYDASNEAAHWAYVGCVMGQQ
jgi:hypothetical protein